MFFLIPIAAGVALWRYHANKRSKGTLTPERRAVYTSAMTFLRDPAKLNKLADAFDKGGLKTQATALRKRSVLPTLPKNVQAARQQALKQGLSSTDPVAVNTLADAFEKSGAMASATMLRQYALGLKVTAPIKPIPVPSLLPPEEPPAEPVTPESVAQDNLIVADIPPLPEPHPTTTPPSTSVSPAIVDPGLPTAVPVVSPPHPEISPQPDVNAPATPSPVAGDGGY
jgi:hypothetical protein